MSLPASWLRVTAGLACLFAVVALLRLDPPGARADVDREEIDLTLSNEGKELTNVVGMKFVRIPAGKFTMGQQINEREVKITKEFYLGVHEVTQKQYKRVTGSNPSHFSATGNGRGSVANLNTDDFPVEMVTWDDTQTFLTKLNALDNRKGSDRVYRLPSEAEWEYCCRAGTKTAFHTGGQLDVKDANINNSVNHTCKVGSYKPNAFGLYDMHGNVFEWCDDRINASRPERGGGWSNDSATCSAAARYVIGTTSKYDNLGFRVALVPTR